jgi:hypothetical protein
MLGQKRPFVWRDDDENLKKATSSQLVTSSFVEVAEEAKETAAARSLWSLTGSSVWRIGADLATKVVQEGVRQCTNMVNSVKKAVLKQAKDIVPLVSAGLVNRGKPVQAAIMPSQEKPVVEFGYLIPRSKVVYDKKTKFHNLYKAIMPLRFQSNSTDRGFLPLSFGRDPVDGWTLSTDLSRPSLFEVFVKGKTLTVWIRVTGDHVVHVIRDNQQDQLLKVVGNECELKRGDIVFVKEMSDATYTQVQMVFQDSVPEELKDLVGLPYAALLHWYTDAPETIHRLGEVFPDARRPAFGEGTIKRGDPDRKVTSSYPKKKLDQGFYPVGPGSRIWPVNRAERPLGVLGPIWDEGYDAFGNQVFYQETTVAHRKDYEFLLKYVKLLEQKSGASVSVNVQSQKYFVSCRGSSRAVTLVGLFLNYLLRFRDDRQILGMGDCVLEGAHEPEDPDEGAGMMRE